MRITFRILLNTIGTYHDRFGVKCQHAWLCRLKIIDLFACTCTCTLFIGYLLSRAPACYGVHWLMLLLSNLCHDRLWVPFQCLSNIMNSVNTLKYITTRQQHAITAKGSASLQLLCIWTTTWKFDEDSGNKLNLNSCHQLRILVE